MRIWDVAPATLCRSHLLGEHASPLDAEAATGSVVQDAFVDTPDRQREILRSSRATAPTPTIEETMTGTPIEQRLSLITLGVTEIDRSTRFYREVLGWTPAELGGGEVAFFQLNGLILGLYPREELARDAGVDVLESGGFSRVALAYNVRARDDVDRVLSEVETGGAQLVKPAEDAFWGGRSGYFADPDGFLWEVAWNPGFPMAADGSVRLPGEG